MKVISVTGLTGSGKTTTIERIIEELVIRGYSVGTVKEIHFEDFRIDTEGKNTYRHRKAGASTVTALGLKETDIMYPYKMPIYEILRHYQEDFVVLEGVRNAVAPNISVAREVSEPEVTPLTIAISGRYAGVHSGEYNVRYDETGALYDENRARFGECREIPVIDSLKEVGRLVDLILEKTPDLLPDVEKDCCGACGYDCRGLLSEILAGRETAENCRVISRKAVSVKVDGKEIEMVPFVEKIVKNAVLSVVSELKGYKNGSKIEVAINDNSVKE